MGNLSDEQCAGCRHDRNWKFGGYLGRILKDRGRKNTKRSKLYLQTPRFEVMTDTDGPCRRQLADCGVHAVGY